MFMMEYEIPSLISVSDTLKNKIKGIKVIEIRNASHLLNIEIPAEFNNSVIDFIVKQNQISLIISIMHVMYSLHRLYSVKIRLV